MSAPCVHLLPGGIFAHRQPHVVNTLLGSCVAVALWDERLRHGGITHSLLPSRDGAGEAAGRYADDAVDLLVGALARLGSRREHLAAKLFGGANVLAVPATDAAIGERNVEAALSRLALHGIPLRARRTGGGAGMVVRMDTGTGEVWVRPVHRPHMIEVRDDDGHRRPGGERRSL